MRATGKTPEWLEDCLERIARVSVAVFGDFCLDAYWLIDPDEAEVSIETGLPVHRVREQRYGLGGAGNIVANLVALGVREVQPVGLIGKDLFGRQMLELFERLGVGTAGMLACQDDWQTMVYAKPHLGDREQNRLDFGAFNAMAPASVDALADRLDRAAEACDVVILNQQVPAGLSTPEMIARVNSVIARHPGGAFLADSRHRAELYEGAVLKLNAHEAARICGEDRPPDEPVPLDAARHFAVQLRRQTGLPVFVTLGAEGILVARPEGVHHAPGIEVAGPTDAVGAGDTVTAALAAALGAGGDPVSAASLANIAASVTVRKLRATGTATPEEVRRAAAGPAGRPQAPPDFAGDPHSSC